MIDSSLDFSEKWCMEVAITTLLSLDLPKCQCISYDLSRVRKRTAVSEPNFISAHLEVGLLSIRENYSFSPSRGKRPAVFNQANILLKLCIFCHFKGLIEDAHNEDLTWN